MYNPTIERIQAQPERPVLPRRRYAMVAALLFSLSLAAIPARSAAQSAEKSLCAVSATGGAVNIRSGPTTSSAIVGQLVPGEKMSLPNGVESVEGVDGVWYNLEVGYSRGDLVNISPCYVTGNVAYPTTGAEPNQTFSLNESPALSSDPNSSAEASPAPNRVIHSFSMCIQDVGRNVPDTVPHYRDGCGILIDIGGTTRPLVKVLLTGTNFTPEPDSPGEVALPPHMRDFDYTDYTGYKMLINGLAYQIIRQDIIDGNNVNWDHLLGGDGQLYPDLIIMTSVDSSGRFKYAFAMVREY